MERLRKTVGKCVVRIGLDKRHVYGDKYRLAVIFTLSNKSSKDIYYHRLEELVTEKEYEKIINKDISAGRIGKPDSPKGRHKAWKDKLDDYTKRVDALASSSYLTIDKIKAMLTGKSSSTNFISVWIDVLDHSKAGTEETYKIALNSFLGFIGLPKYYGKSEEEKETLRKLGSDLGFAVDASMIHEWVQKLTDEGKSKTTIGIYLRACRVVVNECCRRGYMAKDINYPFGEKDVDKVSVPRGKSRKHESLPVEKMAELYDIFVNKSYPESWSDDYKSEVHGSLGIFLFMYLGNGMNLADVARLKYDDYYKRNNGQSIRFERTKTRDRTDNNSEVIVPVIPQLKRVMDEIAAPYEFGERMFPHLLKNSSKDKDIIRRVQQENQNIRKRLRNLTESLGWPEQISPTWCRHSFATNLIQQGVPQGYVSEAMGHSTGGNVTLGYVGRFPIEKQMKYNSKLLRESTSDEDDLMNRLKSLSPEELKALLAKLKKS